MKLAMVPLYYKGKIKETIFPKTSSAYQGQ